MLKTISITVAGKVQGVFYRQSTKENADLSGITGEVKNLDNGNVLILATGTEEQLQKLIEWCKKGPGRAEVTAVETAELPFRSFDKFIIYRK